MTRLNRRYVLGGVRSCLVAEGFRSGDGSDVYLLDLGEDAKGWLSLSSDVEAGVVEISPKVGVRHERLHAAIDRLMGRPSGTEPTISKLLGYLMPQSSANLVWRFDRVELVDAQAEGLTSAVLAFGRPFMVANSSLETLVEALPREVPWEYSQMRIPVALALLGRRTEAQAFISAELAKTQTRTDAAAETFREFARRFSGTPVIR